MSTVLLVMSRLWREGCVVRFLVGVSTEQGRLDSVPLFEVVSLLGVVFLRVLLVVSWASVMTSGRTADMKPTGCPACVSRCPSPHDEQETMHVVDEGSTARWPGL